MQSLAKFVVAGALAALFTTAGAQQGACKDDVDKLCKDVQPGEGRVLQCLKTHEKEVSPACTAHLKQVRAQMKAVGEACEADVEKFCFDTTMGKGAVAKCLKSHSADLSADCKAAVAKAKSAKH